MTPEERTTLLDVLSRLAHRDPDAVDPTRTFLPLFSHRRALSRDVVVVLGGKGAGKTSLFKIVNSTLSTAQLRELFQSEELPDATWLDAFSQGMEHPEFGVLEAHAVAQPSDVSLRAFWMAHLLRRVSERVPDVAQGNATIEMLRSVPATDLKSWLPLVEANLGAVSAALDSCERALAQQQKTVMAAYDNLDRIGQLTPGVRRRYLGALLALWLSLTSRYRWLRGKIFLRDDLFDAKELEFADASKLRSRSERIDWDPASLFRVAVRHLANMGSEPMHTWLQDVPGLTLLDRGEFGWIPGDMSPEVQQGFATKMAGKVIGKGALKTSTLRWMIERLQDGQRRLSPRTFLVFLAAAADSARLHPNLRRVALVSSDDMLSALRHASKERVVEIEEEYPLVRRLKNFRGTTIPLNRQDAILRLSKPPSSGADGISAGGELILEELVRLGVLRLRTEGQLDVPDIYRYSYEIEPDYASAWDAYLHQEDETAREDLIRGMPSLREIFQDIKKPPLENAAREAIERKDYKEARLILQRALDLASSMKDFAQQACLLRTLSDISVQQGSPADGVKEIERATRLARQSGDEDEFSMCLSQSVIAYASVGRFPEALSASLEKLRVDRKRQELADVAQCLFFVASVYYFQKDAMRCAGAGRQATLAAISSQNTNVIGSVYTIMAYSLHTLSPEQALWFFCLADCAATSTPWRDSRKKQIAASLGLDDARLSAIVAATRNAYAKDHGIDLLDQMCPWAKDAPQL